MSEHIHIFIYTKNRITVYMPSLRRGMAHTWDNNNKHQHMFSERHLNDDDVYLINDDTHECVDKPSYAFDADKSWNMNNEKIFSTVAQIFSRCKNFRFFMTK